VNDKKSHATDVTRRAATLTRWDQDKHSQQGDDRIKPKIVVGYETEKAYVRSLS